MLTDIILAILGSYALGWLILSTVHYFDRRTARKIRQQTERQLAAEGRTWQQMKNEIEIGKFEHRCNQESQGH